MWRIVHPPFRTRCGAHPFKAMTGSRYPRPSPPPLHVLSSPFLPQVAGLPGHHVAHQSGEDHSGVAPEHELLEGQAFIKELHGNEGEGS